MLNPFHFMLGALIALFVLLSASIMLPHNKYYRYQQYDNVTTRKADWIFERLHFDSTPVDVALIGTSRMAGGLSGPLIEREYCLSTGRSVHVANLAIPATGRNLHYAIAKEAASAKKPSLFVLEVNDVETRRPHPAFVYLADAKDILKAPILINLNYVMDILRLPGRQAILFVETLTGSPRLKTKFNIENYAGPNLDLTEVVISVDGEISSRNVRRSSSEMSVLRQQRLAGMSPKYILPKALRRYEYKFARYYLKNIKMLAAQTNAAVTYAYLPAYGAPAFPDYIRQELGIEKLDFNLGGEVADDPALWLDATHLNADGAHETSVRFANLLVQYYPKLGLAGCAEESKD